MEIKHVCKGCGQVLEVHDHGSRREVKQCLRGTSALRGVCQVAPDVRFPRTGRAA
jgi:hypothetical protein